jgi:hypothetical protein
MYLTTGLVMRSSSPYQFLNLVKRQRSQQCYDDRSYVVKLT